MPPISTTLSSLSTYPMSISISTVITILSSIIDRTIIQTSPKYGISPQLEIGCQIQKIFISNPKNKISDWQPRILSLIQNRILLFRDKSIDYHPLQMISLNSPNFSVHKVECYDHTVSLQCYDTLIYQLHLGDTQSLQSFIAHLKSALELYNKSAIVWFHTFLFFWLNIEKTDTKKIRSVSIPIQSLQISAIK